MNLIPAIDLYEGKCIRLHKGDFNRSTTYSDDPVRMAMDFEQLGCTHLHLVDLQAARTGELTHLKILEMIASRTRLTIDFGGGINSTAKVRLALNAGASQVTAGSIAVNDRDLVLDWLREFGSESIILGADALDRKIAINGWQQLAEVDVIDYIRDFAAAGFTQTICTDIQQDGTLSGPSNALYERIISEVPDINLIASGGIRDVADLKALKDLGLSGAIVGKAIYEGTLDIVKALQVC